MTKLHQLEKMGQSIWVDYIRRSFIESGELQELIDAGVKGVTSNPAIFEKAIAGSADYDEALRGLSRQGKPAEEIYEILAIEDIQHAADLLKPVFESTGGADGFVSLEVNPLLARDTAGTITEGKRLFAAVDRPNIMIKVPGTPEGIPAVETLITQGINVNVTLLFSLDHYEAAAEAYIAGLEKRLANGGSISIVRSVASYFISRIDSAVDQAIVELGKPELLSNLGTFAIDSARSAYLRFLEITSEARWKALAAEGAQPQRLLWASTSTKNPNYPDTKYVDALIGPHTVTTVPPATLRAFIDHGTVAETLTSDLLGARINKVFLMKQGIWWDDIENQLQVEGVEKFAKPFDSLMSTIREKIAQLENEELPLEAYLGHYQETVENSLAEIEEQEIIDRIWNHDFTVWQPEPDEITNRLGWLHSPDRMVEELRSVRALIESVRADGFSDVLLLGMGGSSLAPEVFGHAFSDSSNHGPGHGHDGLNLSVLDSTDPAAIETHSNTIDPAHTLFIVSTKSGGTVETLSFFKYFYNKTVGVVGSDSAGEHFVAITDKGSGLHELAQHYRFRQTFLNDPNIGGRYAALSYFGLVPAGLVGVDLDLLLERALVMVRNNESCNCPVDGDNLGGRLGTIMGELARAGRDKLTLITSPGLANFGDWIEQLIAESTGKNGTGILPVVGERLGGPEVYGDDRWFVHLRLRGDETLDKDIESLMTAGFPIVTLHLRNVYDMGGQFFLWEMATAVASHLLGIHPFNQPNVESAKVLARKMVQAYKESGRLPEDDTEPLNVESLVNFLTMSRPGDYIAIQAYVQPGHDTTRALRQLQRRLRDRTKLATTLGYGPRFLHSTGQLHKGDGGNGLFIQLVSESRVDLPIPDEAGKPASSITFGVLKAAQALGDAEALRETGRRIIRFSIGPDIAAELNKMTTGL